MSDDEQEAKHLAAPRTRYNHDTARTGSPADLHEVGSDVATFGRLLRRYRLAAGLTQELLADRARLSLNAVSALERGYRQSPYRDTFILLADALGLTAEQRAALEATLSRDRVLTSGSPSVQHGAVSPPYQAPAVPLSETPPAAAPPRTPRSTTLPTSLTPLIGREAEVATIGQLLANTEVRLLTLTGPGGVGKTRLAQQAAAELAARVPSKQVVFVPLAAVSDPALVLAGVAQALHVREAGSQPLAASLAAHLAGRRTVLLLDNFEQLLAAASAVEELLLACPGLQVLVTSRAPLRVPGEQEFPVSPLAIPDLRNLPAQEALSQIGAVVLFVQRAQAVKPSFMLTVANAPTVAAICSQLDGLPLALELAATRIKILPPAALLKLLGQEAQQDGSGGALDVLRAAPPYVAERHQTLRHTIAWSCRLLALTEQALFRRLAVFAGGATLEAMAAVTGSSEVVLLDWLAALVDNSLVRQEEADPATGDPTARFTMLETIHAYGREALLASGELASMRQAHAAYFLAWVEAASRAWEGARQASVLSQIEVEHDNLRSALGCLQETGEIERGLRLAKALTWFWDNRGHHTEGRRWLEDLLAQGDAAERAAPLVRAQALGQAGWLAHRQGANERAVSLLEQGLAISRAANDRECIAVNATNLGLVLAERSEHARALALLEEGLALRRVLGNPHGISATLSNLGLIACYRGDMERARVWLTEGLAIVRTLDEPRKTASLVNNLGMVALFQGDTAAAVALFEESLTLQRALGDTRGCAIALGNLGELAEREGALDRATRLYEESLMLVREIGQTRIEAGLLCALGSVAVRLGAYPRACSLALAGLRLAQPLGDQGLFAALLDVQGRATHGQGDMEAALALYAEALRLFRQMGDSMNGVVTVEHVATVAQSQGHAAQAVRLYAAAATLRTALNTPLVPADRPQVEEAVTALRAALGEDAFAVAWAAGAALSPDQMLAEALSYAQE